MNILVTIDENYVNYFKNMILSVFYRNEIKLNVYIVYNYFNFSIKKEIEDFFYNNKIGEIFFINLYKNDNMNFLKKIEYYKQIKLFKLFFPFFIKKNLDRILYLDCDVLCNDNILDFYNQDFNDNLLIGCKDFELSNDEYSYLNTGVIIFNIKKYKELISFNELKEIVVLNKQNLSDLEIINNFFYNKIKLVDEKYNYQINYIFSENDYASIIHFKGNVKPWNEEYCYPIKAIQYYNFLNYIGEYNLSNKLSNLHFKNASQLLYNPTNINYNMSIDVIIPSYNALSTIHDTLDSIVEQVLDNIKVTVYLIDDCSEQKYDNIIHEYENKINLKYFRMEKNSGVGLARQRGIDEGNGDFFTIIDSDDKFYSPYAIKSMFYAMMNSNADMVRSVFMGDNIDRCGNFVLFRENNIGCHGKLYRKKFILDNKIRYLDLRGNEDTAYHALLKFCGAKIYDVDILTYKWCFNPNSFTRSDENYVEKDIITLAKGFVWTVEELLKRKSVLGDIRNYIAELFGWVYFRFDDCNYKETKKNVCISLAKILSMYNQISNDNIIDRIVAIYDIENYLKLYDFVNSLKKYL